MATKHAVKEVNGVDLEVLEQTLAAVKQDPGFAKCKFRARNKWLGGTKNQTALSDFFAAKEEMRHQHPFELNCDEPPLVAGEDAAPNPVEHLLNALAGCVTTSIVAHAAVRGIHLDEVESELEGDIDMRGFFGLDNDVPKGFSNIRVKFRIKTNDANAEQLKSLAAFSPVFNTITKGARVDIQINVSRT